MSAVSDYLKKIEGALKEGNSTEHTHRPALKGLIEALRPGVIATNEPQRTDCGSPDFIITSKSTPLGYVEAKDVGIDLERAAESEQLQRYRSSLRNLILTDYLTFRLYRNGDLVQETSLAQWKKGGGLRATKDGPSELEILFNAFFDSDVPTISSPRELAERMARMARLLQGLIRAVFSAEHAKGDLHAQYEAFRKVLIEDLSIEQFADMYAQTIAYGLFAARCNHPGTGFTRQIAGSDLPKTNPFLRRLFNSIAGADLDERISWAVDDLSELLAKADIGAVLKDFGSRTRREDPVVHFYETFLAAYDPKLRELRGVYYTPEPIVGFIVRSVDALLKKDFKLPDGLADSSKFKLKAKGKRKSDVDIHRVQILDPACGTGTFLHAIIRSTHERFKGSAGLWPSYVTEHLLPRIYGFELLMAPYAVAHMKLALQLKESGYDFRSDERLRVFLTNTLEEAHAMTGLPLFTRWLAEEAASASEIKQDAPIMVILGNPPYSGHSANKGLWITSLLEDYKKSAELKRPAQAKWLSDDYVKFIRFAQWRIEQTGYGVLALITNHSYLDNPTFMDMRRSLMATFDDIYVLDLHGSLKKKERDTEGGKDENVFDIQQGVAISILVRKNTRASKCTVRRADVWGERDSKYEWLDKNDVVSTKWDVITPQSSPWLFVKQDQSLLSEYEKGWSIVDVMNKHGAPVPGFATQHDEFAISFTRDEAIEKVRKLLDTKSESEARELFKLCAQDQWRYERAKAQLTESGARGSLIEVDYRPYDARYTVYDRNVLTHRRERISPQLLRPNVALVVPKNAEAIGSDDSQFFFVVDRPTDLNFFRRGGAYLLPLWIYPDEEKSLFDDKEGARVANFSDEFIAEAEVTVGASLATPENLFAYLYAILHSRGYKARYGNFLKRGFPRVVVTSDKKLFLELARLGQRLIDASLLKQPAGGEPDYPVAGDNSVDEVRFDGGRVYINARQYFSPIDARTWEFQVGGYQVAERFMKERRGRQLTFDELSRYRRIIAALTEIEIIRDQIEKAAPTWPLS